MKLRNYKNDTSYNAPKPWQFPCKRSFEPKALYTDEKQLMSQTLKDYKYTYNDNFPEKNQAFTKDLVSKHVGIMQSSFWGMGLRGNDSNKKRSNTKK